MHGLRRLEAQLEAGCDRKPAMWRVYRLLATGLQVDPSSRPTAQYILSQLHLLLILVADRSNANGVVIESV